MQSKSHKFYDHADPEDREKHLGASFPLHGTPFRTKGRNLKILPLPTVRGKLSLQNDYPMREKRRIHAFEFR